MSSNVSDSGCYNALITCSDDWTSDAGRHRLEQLVAAAAAGRGWSAEDAHAIHEAGEGLCPAQRVHTREDRLGRRPHAASLAGASG